MQSGNPAHCVELIQSIEFQNLTTPIEELLYFITYLYVQTNKFQTLPTNQQVATAEQRYHFYLNAEQTEEPQQQQQAQIHQPDPNLDNYLESISGLFQLPSQQYMQNQQNQQNQQQ
ncbi:MAG: hypothetical protein JO131_02095, partial [Gammaproteobacteria bacterium]|nr:hypothetical protein [Gammaproteobacteria bacterium]